VLRGGHPYDYIIHDRDSILSSGLDQSVKDVGVEVLRTAVRKPKANAICERWAGTAGHLESLRLIRTALGRATLLPFHC
jgi:hypothetical protein